MDLIEMEKVGRKTTAELRKTKALVEDVLAQSERARNSDQWLILCVMQRMGEEIKVEYDKEKKTTVITWRMEENLKNFGSFETIRRVRQEIQNKDGKYLPTDPRVTLKRRIREAAVRQYYGKG